MGGAGQGLCERFADFSSVFQAEWAQVSAGSLFVNELGATGRHVKVCKIWCFCVLLITRIINIIKNDNIYDKLDVYYIMVPDLLHVKHAGVLEIE